MAVPQVHDDPMAHQLELTLYHGMLRGGRPVTEAAVATNTCSLSLEMLERGCEQDLAVYYTGQGNDCSGEDHDDSNVLARLLSGWSVEDYGPLLAAAREFAQNFSRFCLRTVVLFPRLF
jgi:uncharacterized iron-regulated protein